MGNGVGYSKWGSGNSVEMGKKEKVVGLKDDYVNSPEDKWVSLDLVLPRKRSPMNGNETKKKRTRQWWWEGSMALSY